MSDQPRAGLPPPAPDRHPTTAADPAGAPALDLPAEPDVPAGSEARAAILRARLTERRLRHSLGVAHLAAALARRFGLDPAPALLAGLVHDSARELTDEPLRELAARDDYPLPPRESPNHVAELHAPAGVTLARELFGVHDAEVLEAIRRHTFGEGTLSPLGAVLFVADKVEPRGRGWPALPEGFGAALRSLDTALLFAYDYRIATNLRRGRPIDVRTIHARNALLARLGEVRLF